MDFNIEKYKYIFLLPIPITTLPTSSYKKCFYQLIGGVLFLESYNIVYSIISGIVSGITNTYSYLLHNHEDLEHSIEISAPYVLEEVKELAGELKEVLL